MKKPGTWVGDIRPVSKRELTSSKHNDAYVIRTIRRGQCVRYDVAWFDWCSSVHTRVRCGPVRDELRGTVGRDLQRRTVETDGGTVGCSNIGVQTNAVRLYNRA